MNSLPTQAIFGAVTAILAAVLAATVGSVPLVLGAVTVSLVACVAFAAQSERLRGEDSLVYRPVYARRHDGQRRVRSDD